MAAVGFHGGLALHNPAPAQHVVPEDFVREMLGKYMEIPFLADPTIRPPDGAQRFDGVSSSMYAFNNNEYYQFDVLVYALYKLQLIFNGDYDGFIAGQKHNVLSRASFVSLKEEGDRILAALGISQKALSVALLLKNLCHAPPFKVVFNPPPEFNINDQFAFWKFLMRHLSNHSQDVVSYGRLLQEKERLVVSTAGALAQFDQIFEGRQEPEIFEPLASMAELDHNILAFALFVESCDAAGRSPFNQEVFDRYQEVKRLCEAARRQQ